jgi:peptidoglycan hydrolase-like protein with peptidoglycan-binding domain
MPAADTTLYAVWEEIPEEHHSSHSSGGSVQSQVKNLNAMGNTTAAESLKAQWPQLFSATSSDSGAVLGTAGSVRDLELGMTGDDVLALQKLLNANGFAVAASGPGAPGSETAYFGTLTKAALAAYQKAHGIAPAAGYFGPITRTQMKSAGLIGLWWQ